MALTRKMLKAMGIEDDKIEQIIDAHTETTDSLKEERDKYKADAEKLPSVQKELNELKADSSANDYKAKYEKAKKDYDDLVKKGEDEKNHADKVKLIREYYESKNIKDKNLTIAMRGTNVDDFEVENGKLKDTSAIDELIKGDFAGLVMTVGTNGADTKTPPANNGNAGVTKETIMAIKDRTERRRQIAEHLDLFEQKGN